MKAIILSAGQGRRLLPLTERVPKCMLPVQDRPLIAWQLDSLLRCGIREIAIVVGYGADAVEAGLAQFGRPRQIRAVYNPFFATTDNLVSCWVARGEMQGEFLILNGDTLFEAAALERLLSAPEHPITLAVSCKNRYDEDDMKVIREGDRLVRVGKTLPLERVNAESIGMMTFRGEGPRLFREAIDRAMRNPEALKQWYLSLIDTLAGSGVVYTQEISAQGWAEVDSVADLQRAATAGSPWLAAGGQPSVPA